MNKANRCYVDIHVLQTVPPSCVNRDDTGSPKTAVYGGVTRARVSSQSWKHAVRLSFQDIFEESEIGLRTKRLPALIAEEIRSIDSKIEEKNAEKMAVEVLKLVKNSKGKEVFKLEKDLKVETLFFMSREQAHAIAELAISGSKDKNAYNKALQKKPAIDMALFGRMLAEEPALNYDAAAQVAHSISTHAVHNEYDYFTAVDDYKEENSSGAAHVDTSEYNSATLYRYANVNIAELLENIDKEAIPMAVRGFVEAFVTSMPTGKQNSYANRTYPDMVYVTVRKNQPVNLVGAFEKPVVSACGYAEASEERFVEYAKTMDSRFAGKPDAAFAVGGAVSELTETMSLHELLDKLEAYISEEVC